MITNARSLQDGEESQPNPLPFSASAPNVPSATDSVPAGGFGYHDWKRVPLADEVEQKNSTDEEDGSTSVTVAQLVYYISCATGVSRWDNPSLADELKGYQVCVWDQLVDEDTGATYYRNQTTGITRWETRWEQYTNTSGQCHWYNNLTKQSQWDAPEWSDAVDADSGQIYYTNNYTMKSRWTPPAEWDGLADTCPTHQQQSTFNAIISNDESSTVAGGSGMKRDRSSENTTGISACNECDDDELQLVHPTPLDAEEGKMEAGQENTDRVKRSRLATANHAVRP